MYRVTEIIEFCYGHRLLRYQGKCAHLHGHNGRVEIVKAWIDQNLDHRMLLHREDPLVDVLRRNDEPVFLMDGDPTAESIARVICEYAVSQGLKVREVRLWETPSSVAAYSPGR